MEIWTEVLVKVGNLDEGGQKCENFCQKGRELGSQMNRTLEFEANHEVDGSGIG